MLRRSLPPILRIALAVLVPVLVGSSCTSPPPPPPAVAIPTSVAAPAGEAQYLQFAWDVFLAINAPAPDRSGRVVWETWKEAYDIFRDGVEPPSPWGAPDLPPPGCEEAFGDADRRVIRQVTKSSGDHDFSDILDERTQAVGGILIDRNGMLTRYEVRVDQPMFDAIVQDKLYDGQVQAVFPKRIDWPVGSMELKASWRELTPSEAADPKTAQRFYVTEALLYNDPGAPDEWKIGRFGFPEGGPCKLAKESLGHRFPLGGRTHGSRTRFYRKAPPLSNPDPLECADASAL